MLFWFEMCYSSVHVQYLFISPSVPNSYVTYQSLRPQRYISAPYSLRKKMAAVTDSVNTILHLIVVCLYSIVTNLRILNNRSLYHACKGMFTSQSHTIASPCCYSLLHPLCKYDACVCIHSKPQ